ncbi:hypothetical protein DB346_07360 [Verrucomicrobia bacterium LW23]|nr:hypothetical protein DB346_07360 [Verrucomicrobia bacterium LW23]
MKFVLFYDLAPDGLPRIMEHFPGHQARVNEFHARGVLIGAGPLGSPPQGAMAIFTTREAAEEFAAGDPFVIHHAVSNWRLTPWNAAFL